ncbi:MAG: hypothetical protein ACQESR_06920 [Planctomycetota bacterium]
MESCPTQAVLPLVGLAAEKVIRDRYISGQAPSSETQPSLRGQVGTIPARGIPRLFQQSAVRARPSLFIHHGADSREHVLVDAAVRVVSVDPVEQIPIFPIRR